MKFTLHDLIRRSEAAERTYDEAERDEAEDERSRFFQGDAHAGDGLGERHLKMTTLLLPRDGVAAPADGIDDKEYGGARVRRALLADTRART